MFAKGLVRVLPGFAQRLKELREYHGLTQADVAKCVHLTSSAIGNYERGAREPGIKELVLLADFFHVSLDELVGCADIPAVRRKTKQVYYMVVDTLEVAYCMKAKEIDSIVRVLAEGKPYFWEEIKK